MIKEEINTGGVSYAKIYRCRRRQEAEDNKLTYLFVHPVPFQECKEWNSQSTGKQPILADRSWF